MLFVLFWTLFSFVLPGWTALVNITIDDSTGDSLTHAPITYSPADAWANRTSCQDDSSTCVAHPDAAKLVGGTWHESSFSVSNTSLHPNVPSTAALSFNGSAVYVNCAIPRSTFAPDGTIQLTFFLDGVQAGSFQRDAIAGTGFDYVIVFSSTDLTPASHSLVIQNGVQGGPNSLLVLDAILYTTESANLKSTTSASRGISRATVAVVVVLLLCVVIILVVLAVFLFRRKRRRRGVYAPYMPKGGLKAFPPSLEPSPMSTPSLTPAPSPRFLSTPGYGAVTMPPPTYSGAAHGNWWAGRDRKLSPGFGPHRPYDLNPSGSSLQGLQSWER